MQAKFLLVLVALACLLCLAVAQVPDGIIKDIIAQYEALGGESKHHPPEQAHVIDYTKKDLH